MEREKRDAEREKREADEKAELIAFEIMKFNVEQDNIKVREQREIAEKAEHVTRRTAN